MKPRQILALRTETILARVRDSYNVVAHFAFAVQECGVRLVCRDMGRMR